jgi:hypothetical protein
MKQTIGLRLPITNIIITRTAAETGGRCVIVRSLYWVAAISDRGPPQADGVPVPKEVARTFVQVSEQLHTIINGKSYLTALWDENASIQPTRRR